MIFFSMEEVPHNNKKGNNSRHERHVTFAKLYVETVLPVRRAVSSRHTGGKVRDLLLRKKIDGQILILFEPESMRFLVSANQDLHDFHALALSPLELRCSTCQFSSARGSLDGHAEEWHLQNRSEFWCLVIRQTDLWCLPVSERSLAESCGLLGKTEESPVLEWSAKWLSSEIETHSRQTASKIGMKLRWLWEMILAASQTLKTPEIREAN